MYRNEKRREPFKRGSKSKGKGSIMEQKIKDISKQLYNAVVYYKDSTVVFHVWMSQTKKGIFKTWYYWDTCSLLYLKMQKLCQVLKLLRPLQTNLFSNPGWRSIFLICLGEKNDQNRYLFLVMCIHFNRNKII